MTAAQIVARAPGLSALVACVAGGALCAWLHTPLPWMIGPLFMMAILKVAGLPLASPRGGREAGQIIIATALGLYFTPHVAGEVFSRWEVCILAAVFATALSYAGAYVISRFTDTDRTTAFFASVPGGATEMAILGERFGAKPDRIAVAQSLRILLVVTIVPFGFTVLGVSGSDAYEQLSVPASATGLGLMFAAATAGGFAFRLLRVPNAFMLGPLCVAVGLTAGGVQWTSMPPVLSAAGQVLLGCALGARFEREFVRRAPWFAFVVCASVVASIAASAAFAVALARMAELPVATVVLATAPGGIAEMAITAKVLQLGVPLVTAAHVTRVVILVTTTAPLFRVARVAWRRIVNRSQNRAD